MEHTFNIQPLHSWWPGQTRPLLISGPCSAETEEQVVETAQRLARTGKVHLLRAGLWKPRTRPDSFEGIGEKGLIWLKRASELTGLPITTEVATAQHVEACLKHGVDVLWIGARTTVNPFSVQEIADALKGVDIPVIVKNPLNADLQLWLGALERVNRAGITKLAAMHRGFSFYGEKKYRNRPLWEIPIALKALHPELPIFCDPSHICGNRELLQEVAQQALDLGMSGLMLESHITPDLAWSDAAQQITPEALSELIDRLHIRQTQESSKATDQLTILRNEIDKFDEEIIQLIAQRMQISEQVGVFKAARNLQPFDVERWNEIRKSRSQWARDLDLSDDFIFNYLDQLHNESLRKQTQVMNQETSPEKQHPPSPIIDPS